MRTALDYAQKRNFYSYSEVRGERGWGEGGGYYAQVFIPSKVPKTGFACVFN